MKHRREEHIRCVCGWTGYGYGGDPCPRCGSTERALSGVLPSGDLDIGGGVTIRLDEDGGGLIWRHPGCRAWMTLRYKPDPKSTGHVLVEQWSNLTIEGSLLCPAGCGKHGWIRGGRWSEG